MKFSNITREFVLQTCWVWLLLAFSFGILPAAVSTGGGNKFSEIELHLGEGVLLLTFGTTVVLSSWLAMIPTLCLLGVLGLNRRGIAHASAHFIVTLLLSGLTYHLLHRSAWEYF